MGYVLTKEEQEKKEKENIIQSKNEKVIQKSYQLYSFSNKSSSYFVDSSGTQLRLKRADLIFDMINDPNKGTAPSDDNEDEEDDDQDDDDDDDQGDDDDEKERREKTKDEEKKKTAGRNDRSGKTFYKLFSLSPSLSFSLFLSLYVSLSLSPSPPSPLFLYTL